MLGQDLFYLGLNFLCFSKDNLNEQDKRNLINQTDFDILMSIINSKEMSVRMSINSAELLLSLLFPDFQIKKMPNMLLLTRILQDQTKEQVMINVDNFDQFKGIIEEMFCLKGMKGGGYNPANKKAAQIAKKLEERRKKLSEKKGQGDKEINILYRYVSILTIGNHHTIPELMEYTVYQLFNEFQRFERKMNFDSWYQAKLAGAENLEDVDSWLAEPSELVQTRPQSNKIVY